MPHNIIQIQELSLILPHKICFKNFSTHIHFGDKIGLVGRNGSGKSTLLNFIASKTDHMEGKIQIPAGLKISYVPQILEIENSLSGGQQFNKAFSDALSFDPDLLLLDEPTNHLDIFNRKSLIIGI